MFKKIIAGLLSAVMSTVLITADFDNVRQVDEETKQKAEKTVLDNGFSVNSTNSLGNYINDAMQQKEQPQKMSNQISNYNYDVGFAEFDKETKKLNVYSSQSSDVKVSVVFKDEDTAESAYAVEYEAERGENTFNTYDVEVTSLPEYFTVDVMLFDSFNTPVCEPYTITTYTRFVQEMKATDIHDYDEDYVVNLDEDETTNFIVLNENTVKAETTENTNILVSADYENDQYVFEHIDDTIRYLDKGDHFFIQPTEDDIIALSVGDISIEGDRAVLTGDENTEGIFDIIKIETCSDDIRNVTVDEEGMSDNVKYNGIVNDENGEEAFEYIIDNEYAYNAEDIDAKRKAEAKVEFKFGEEDDKDDPDKVDLNKPNFKKSKLNSYVKKAKVTEKFKGKLTVSLGCEFQFYMGFFHVDFEVKFTPKVALEFEFEGKVKVPVNLGPYGWVVFTGLWVGFRPNITFEMDGKIIFKDTYGYDYVWSFDTSRDKMFSYTCEPIKDEGRKIQIEADLSIKFDLQPQMYLISEHVVKITLKMPAEIGVSCKSNNFTESAVKKSQTSPVTMLLTDKYYEKDTAHTCGLCFKIEPYATFSAKLEIEAKCIPFLDPFEFDLLDKDDFNLLKEKKMYYSATHGVSDFGDCPYQAYKTTFDLGGSKDISEAGAEINVDGVVGETDNDGIINFYCENGSHNYKIYVDGKEVRSGSFTIDSAVKTIAVSLVDNKTDASDGSKIVPPEPEEGDTLPSHIEEIPERSAEKTYIESGRLGDEIFYFVYPNGEMHIHGSGDMYDFSNTPIANLQKVENVIISDNFADSGEYITSIGNNLFRGATNLETVYLSNEITKIGDDAFNGCKSLKYFRYGGENDTTETLVLPSKLETIGNWAFYECSSAVIRDLVIGSNTKTIGEGAFAGCSEITSVVIPETVTKIEPKVFRGCKKLETADIRAKVADNKMGAGLFYNCEALEELTVPTFNSFYYYRIWIDGSISEGQTFAELFYNCENKYDTQIPSALKKVTVLNGTEIPDNYFSGFKHIETYALPEGITYIGKNAFYSNASLSKIICNDKTKDLSFSEMIKDVENIGEGAFSSGDQIGSNLEIGELVFGNKLKSIGGSAFSKCNKITRVEIPENVTKIEPLAFSYCGKIETAVIKANVTDNKMGAGLFYGCNSLKELTVPCFTEFYYFLPSPKWDVDYDMLTGNVFSMLFNNCSVAGETIVPSTLKKVTILSGTEIPDNYFSGSGNIETYALPEGITSIGIRAFYSSASIKKIICNDENKDLTFSELFKDVEYIGMEAFREDKNLEIGELVFGNKLDSIGSGAFIRCGTIKSVVIPESTTVIEPTVFYECGNIKTAVIKANVTDNIMGAGMFCGCDLLEELTLPNFNDFYYNAEWRGNGVQEKNNVFSMLFNDCSIKGENRIPSTLKKLTILNGENMPKNCLDGFKLKTLVLPSELKFADSNATQDIKDTYEEVIYKGTEEEWANVVIEDPNDPLRGPITFSTEEWKTGDANGDGDIDMSDIVLIMQALANPNKYGINGTDPTHITENGFKYGDVNGDGLTVNDAVRIQEYLLGKISTLA